MKSFGMLKIPMILVGLGVAIFLSPACKAQEMSPDHFTDPGVQDVYDGGASKAAAPKLQHKQPTTHQSNSPAILQPVAKRTAVSTQPGAQAIADRRKAIASAPKKQ